jgi:hypothetical protein
MISPMTRCWSKSCCDNPDRVKNLSDPYYQSILLASLKEAKQNLKDFLFTEGRRNFRVLDPNVDIQSLKVEDVWVADPIHPLPAVFTKIAEAVAKIVAAMRENVDRKRSNNNRGDNAATTSEERRFRTGSTGTSTSMDRTAGVRGRSHERGHFYRGPRRGAGGPRGGHARDSGAGYGYGFRSRCGRYY